MDFIQDQRAVHDSFVRYTTTGSADSNLFDELIDTVDRLQNVDGKKEIVLIACGCDSHSKSARSETLERLRKSSVVVSTVLMAHALGASNDTARNETLIEIANATGGAIIGVRASDFPNP